MIMIMMVMITTIRSIKLIKTFHHKRFIMTIDNYSTKVNFPTSTWKIDYYRPVLFIGSCFSENISTELTNMKYKLTLNPHGILFNPISISKCLMDVVTGKEYEYNDLFIDNNRPDILHSWNHHSSFSGTLDNFQNVLEHMNLHIRNAQYYIKNCRVLFITLGSAFVHELKQTGEIVANCHKQPSTLFHKRLLGIDEIVNHIQDSIELCKSLNPDIKVVFTVSPVRHTREGIVENMRSKARLLEAVHLLIDHEKDRLSYFPAYEYLMDELRDYRWYAEDMIHLSSLTVQRIFEQFTNCYVSSDCVPIMKEISSIKSDINHRPQFIHSEAYITHLKNTLKRIHILSDRLHIKNISINFDEEIQSINSKLHHIQSNYIA